MSDGSDTDEQPSDKALDADSARESQSDSRWGLWPTSKENRAPEWHELFHYWFVQYNPLYFFSAFSVLAGVYLLAFELDGNAVSAADGDWSLAQVMLFSVIQLYEFLLIAAAGFLVHKVGLIRPAVILTLLEGVFVFDCTFRLETISHLGILGTVLSIVWVMLLPAKVWLIGKALRIDIPRTVIWLVTGGGAGLAIMLQTLGLPDVDRTMILLLATWWGAALFAIAVIAKPRISPSGAVGAASELVCRRIGKSLLMILVGIYFYHVFNYVIWVGVDDGQVIGPLIGTAFLLVALLRASEREIWFGAALSLSASFTHAPSALPMCFLVTVVLLYRARQSGNTRFLVGAVLSGYLATWTFAWSGGHLPAPPIWPTVVAGSVLVFLAWKLREPLAVLVLALGGLGIAARYDFNPMHLLPQTRLGLGILLVAAGFVALTVGVWVNWWFRSPTRAIGHSEDNMDVPLDGSGAGV
jgi:hypothetical protein